MRNCVYFRHHENEINSHGSKEFIKNGILGKAVLDQRIFMLRKLINERDPGIPHLTTKFHYNDQFIKYISKLIIPSIELFSISIKN